RSDRTWSPETMGRDCLTPLAGDTDVGVSRAVALFHGARPIRYHCNVITDDFHEAFADHEELVAAVFPNDDFAREHPCQQRHVGWIDPDLPLNRRHRDPLPTGRGG